VNRSEVHPWVYHALVVHFAASTKANLIMIKRTTSSQLCPHPHLDTSASLGTYKAVSVSELCLGWYRYSRWWQ
jgi:hypothetical protein